MIGKDWMLITSELGGKIACMTAGWGGLGVMWEKNVVSIVIRESRFTREIVDGSNSFSVSFFSDEARHREVLKYMGSVTGRNTDKIQGSGVSICYRGEIPYIDDASTVITCRTMCRLPIPPESFVMDWIDTRWYADHDYHMMYIGEIVNILAR